VLVRLPATGRKDQGHTPGWPLAREFEREEVRDLYCPPVVTPGKHIVAKQEVRQCSEALLGSCRVLSGLALEFLSNPPELWFRIAIEKHILALVGIDRPALGCVLPL